jgi:hypothetical protein
MRVLYTCQEVRKEIQRIFAHPLERRVAIVAYVGKGALAHLPKPKGLEVYCWPQPGGTDACAVESLIARRASVFFADRMHMKVYWSSKSGAIIASANLSDNALGMGNLREAGVALASKHVEIDRLIGSIGAKLADPAAIERLRQKEDSWRGKYRGNGKVNIPTFAEWFDGSRRSPWKWDYFNNWGGGASRRAKAAAKQIDPIYVPQEYVYCKRGALHEEDWVLRVRLTTGGLLLTPEWVYVERVVLVEKNDPTYNKDYPYQAVQARERRHCPAPPFRIDPSFKKALRATSARWGQAKVAAQVESKAPTPAFLEKIRSHL